MENNKWALLGIIASAMLLDACASIVSGTTQQVSFQSTPDEATVTVSGRIIGKTPVTVQLDKKENQILVFEKDGYKPLTMQLTTTMDSWFWGNILLGGLIGSTTDAISGAVYEYSPSQYFVSLQPEGPRTESATLKSQRDKVKDFIVIRYAALVADLAKGGGQEVSSLMQLLNIEKDKQADALSKMQALSEIFKDAPTFADQVIALYLK